MWDLVGNPEDRFSQNEAQLINVTKTSKEKQEKSRNIIIIKDLIFTIEINIFNLPLIEKFLSVSRLVENFSD